MTDREKAAIEKFKNRFQIVGKRVTEQECDGTCIGCMDAGICAVAKREMEEEIRGEHC